MDAPYVGYIQDTWWWLLETCYWSWSVAWKFASAQVAQCHLLDWGW